MLLNIRYLIALPTMCLSVCLRAGERDTAGEKHTHWINNHNTKDVRRLPYRLRMISLSGIEKNGLQPTRLPSLRASSSAVNLRYPWWRLRTCHLAEILHCYLNRDLICCDREPPVDRKFITSSIERACEVGVCVWRKRQNPFISIDGRSALTKVFCCLMRKGFLPLSSGRRKTDR